MIIENVEELRQLVKEKFKKLNISQAKFARKHNVPQSNISNFLAGNKDSSISTVLPILAGLELSLHITNKAERVRIAAKKPRYSRDEFVKYVNEGNTSGQICEKFDISLQCMYRRIFLLRQRGYTINLNIKKTNIQLFKENHELIKKRYYERKRLTDILIEIELEPSLSKISRLSHYIKDYIKKTQLS